jgi:hypothetical protein
VTELEILRRRRELVLLSAELQRATVARRLDRINASPVRVALGLATSAVSVPLLWKLGASALALATRAYRRRSVKERLFATSNR